MSGNDNFRWDERTFAALHINKLASWNYRHGVDSLTEEIENIKEKTIKKEFRKRRSAIGRSANCHCGASIRFMRIRG